MITKLREKHPLIHCITNPISINQCANAILAVGGRPMMAEHPSEVGEITPTAGALLLNIGNITDVRMESMKIAALAAQDNGIPVVVDAVGVACSRLRKDYLSSLFTNITPAVLKGNYSEIMALGEPEYLSSGVDADQSLPRDAVECAALSLAGKLHCVILASGAVDIVTDGKMLYHLYNGTPQLASITGTGCMLGALCAAFCGVGSPLDAVCTACSVLGISGERAQKEKGSGTFQRTLMDELSTITQTVISENRKMEEVTIETI